MNSSNVTDSMTEKSVEREAVRECDGERHKERESESKSITDSDLVLAGKNGEQRGPFMWLLSQ